MAGAVFRAVQKACDAVLQKQQLEGAIATGKAARLKEEGAVKSEFLSESVSQSSGKFHVLAILTNPGLESSRSSSFGRGTMFGVSFPAIALLKYILFFSVPVAENNCFFLFLS